MFRESGSIPEVRGMSMAEEREDLGKHYNAASYAAQYGITVDDAEDVIATTNNHGQAKAAIKQMLAADPEARRKAMFLE